MRYLKDAFTIFLLMGFSSVGQGETGQPITLDTLLKQVREGGAQVQQVNREREAQFLQSKNQQSQLLAKAQNELKSLERESDKLKLEFEANEKKLTKIEENLNIAKGTLGEMFGVVRQVAGDLRGQFKNSVISAQISDRDDFLGHLTQAKTLPDIKDLEQLWFELQQEMTESGKVARFERPVVFSNGETKTQTVVRVGSFNLLSEDSYLEYQGTTGQVMKLAKQPSGRWTGLVDDFVEQRAGFASIGIDPSRGAILGMLIQTPSFLERIQQGGLIGYIILILLAVGLAIVGERWIVLTRMEKKIQSQIQSEQIREDNPLGQIMAAFEKYKKTGLETLELKLDETIVRVAPALKRGINTVKILSGVAPLMGLLGTVTGMILTFQSITLFGTGDPKLMAGGISQALMTTVLGLVCAIPLILLHNLIANKSQKLIQILEEESIGLMAARDEGDASHA